MKNHSEANGPVKKLVKGTPEWEEAVKKVTPIERVRTPVEHFNCPLNHFTPEKKR